MWQNRSGLSCKMCWSYFCFVLSHWSILLQHNSVSANSAKATVASRQFPWDVLKESHQKLNTCLHCSRKCTIVDKVMPCWNLQVLTGLEDIQNYVWPEKKRIWNHEQAKNLKNHIWPCGQLCGCRLPNTVKTQWWPNTAIVYIQDQHWKC